MDEPSAGPAYDPAVLPLIREAERTPERGARWAYRYLARRAESYRNAWADTCLVSDLEAAEEA